MAFFDALIFNMDRHEHNFGILRDTENGKILGMAPLYDHNIALITRGFLSDIIRSTDRLITDFVEFIQGENINFSLPILTKDMVKNAINITASYFTSPDELPENTAQFIEAYILNVYEQIECRHNL
jgi:hypothetical protein